MPRLPLVQSEQPLLALQQISREFSVGDQSVSVLHQLSFTLNSGEMVAIVGASGSGKSTLMNLLGCLDRPTSGRYQVAGRDLAHCTADELAALRRERFGFIFQRYHLLPHLNAWQNVALAAHYAGVPAKVRQQCAQVLLTQLGLAHRLDYPPEKLSGGQQQRVSIARALMNGGQIILADEPTGALDSHSSQTILGILHDLHRQGHTIIMVTHDEKIAAQAQRVITLCDGHLVSDHAQITPLATTRSSLKTPEIPPALPAWRAAYTQCYEALQMAWLAIAAHKLRTFLTLLSLIIAVSSVISSIVVGEALKASMLKDFQEFATNKMEIRPGKHYGDPNPNHRRSLGARNLQTLQQQPFIAVISPGVNCSRTLRVGRLNFNSFVYGGDENIFTIDGIAIAQGGPFTAEQVARQAAVAVIDYHVQQQLFPGEKSSIGKILLVGSVPVQVIGITAKTEYADNVQALRIWIPYTTAANQLIGRRHFDRITLSIREGYDPQQAERTIKRLLTLSHGKQDFMILNFDNWLKTQQKMFAKLQRFLLLVALISLLVGGIGIMNILLVSVSERTHEIGICMAIGARQRDVQRQFLIEAVLICLMGGLGGVVLSFMVVGVVQRLNPSWPITVAPLVVLSAVGCSSAIGVIFGYLPARRASRLDPVEALLRE